MTESMDIVDQGGGRAIQPGLAATVEVASARAAQEVQAAMVIAKRFPRDQVVAHNTILDACKRPALAERSQYAYPRGNTTVTGPSIRLAEVLAQNWGNIDFGVVEVEQRRGESTMMAYAHDLQTNTRHTRIFQVKHERHTRNGSYPINDPRDIYEMVANQGARRLRACLLGLIPGDVIDSAIEQCNKTMSGGSKEPLIDRIKKMAQAFNDQFSVTVERIETRLGHRLDAISESELVTLRNVYSSLKDNFASVDSFFPTAGTDDEGKGATESLADRLKKPASPPAPAKTTAKPKATEKQPATSRPKADPFAPAPIAKPAPSLIPDAPSEKTPEKPAAASEAPEMPVETLEPENAATEPVPDESGGLDDGLGLGGEAEAPVDAELELKQAAWADAQTVVKEARALNGGNQLLEIFHRHSLKGVTKPEDCSLDQLNGFLQDMAALVVSLKDKTLDRTAEAPRA